MMFLLIEINSSERNFLIELSPAGPVISVAITLNSCDHNGTSMAVDWHGIGQGVGARR